MQGKHVLSSDIFYMHIIMYMYGSFSFCPFCSCSSSYSGLPSVFLDHVTSSSPLPLMNLTNSWSQAIFMHLWNYISMQKYGDLIEEWRGWRGKVRVRKEYAWDCAIWTLLASYETVGKYCSSQPKRLAQLRSFTGAIYSETTITLN